MEVIILIQTSLYNLFIEQVLRCYNTHTMNKCNKKGGQISLKSCNYFTDFLKELSFNKKSNHTNKRNSVYNISLVNEAAGVKTHT